MGIPTGVKNISVFLPTPSARRATRYTETGHPYLVFLPTPSARRATWPIERSAA